MESTNSDGIESYQSSYQQASKTNTSEARNQIEKELTIIEYEDMLEKFGKTTNLQLKTFLWLCLPVFFPGIVVMSYTFTGGMPNYRCFVENCDENTTISSGNGSYFAPSWHNQAVPLHKQKAGAQCYRYNITRAHYHHCNFNQSDRHMFSEKCSRWVYDSSVFHSTIVSDFELTCDNEWKQTVASSLFMLGMLIGAVSIGYIGDIIGRRQTFTLNIFTLAIVTTASAFSPDWITFCSLRFFSGVCASGHFLIVFVWGIEAVDNKYRVTCGFVFQIVYAVGSACLGLVAYFIRDWRVLQLVISIPMFGLTALFWILPESIKWLLTKKRYPQVKQLLMRELGVNRIHSASAYVLAPGRGDVKHNVDILQSRSISIISDGNDYAKYLKKTEVESLIDIFRSNILLIRLTIISMAWIAGVTGYYGLTYSATTNLVGNFYINYGLSMLVEIPAYLFGMLAVEKIGRRPTLIGGLLISGLGCLIAGLVPAEKASIKTVFSLVAKLFAACVTATLYSYTSELFPTFARSAMVGLCSTSGRIGGILAPIVSDWGRRTDDQASLAFLIFASLNILVGLLCFLLPETKSFSFPATIKEAIKMNKLSYPANMIRTKKQKVEHQER